MNVRMRTDKVSDFSIIQFPPYDAATVYIQNESALQSLYPFSVIRLSHGSCHKFKSKSIGASMKHRFR